MKLGEGLETTTPQDCSEAKTKQPQLCQPELPQGEKPDANVTASQRLTLSKEKSQ